MIKQQILDLLKDGCHCFLPSLVEKHLNERIITQSTTIFHFSLRNVFEACQVYNTVLPRILESLASLVLLIYHF